MLCKDQIQISQLNEHIIERMLYNILPGGNTILHLLSKYEKSEIVEEIYTRATPDKHDKARQVYPIPFLPNLKE